MVDPGGPRCSHVTISSCRFPDICVCQREYIIFPLCLRRILRVSDGIFWTCRGKVKTKGKRGVGYAG